MVVYLDHNATAPLRSEVIDAMVHALESLPGNPLSPHQLGCAARAAVERARVQVAQLVGAKPSEVFFTSGATEANNVPFWNIAFDSVRVAPQLVVGAADHSSVLEAAVHRAQQGAHVTQIPAGCEGALDCEVLRASLSAEPALLCLLWANNETGVVHPVPELAHIARESVSRSTGAKPLWIHVDAVQAVGKLPVDFDSLTVDSLAFSAHKINGPKGVGAIVVKEGSTLRPWLFGGPQERGRRAGTENVAGIIGFGVACALAEAEQEARVAQCAVLRDRLWTGMERAIPHLRRNGAGTELLPNTLNVEFEGASGDILAEALDLEGVCVSFGSACASGSSEPSHVLIAMGRSEAQARSSLRFSVGEGVDPSQIDWVLERLPGIVERVRKAADS